MPCRTRSLAALATVGLSLVSLSASAQTIIDTLPYQNSFVYVRDGMSIGQTFRLPEGANRLDTFTFIHLKQNAIGPILPGVPYRTIIDEWDEINARPVGSPLYTSGQLYFTRESYTTTTWYPQVSPRLLLDPNKQYIAYVSIPVGAGAIDFPPPRDLWHLNGVVLSSDAVDHYPSGNLAVSFPGNQGGAWDQTIRLREDYPVADMAFRANFDMPYHDNVALGKPVTLNGNFGSSPALASTITDGTYLPVGTPRTSAVWWDNEQSDIIVDLEGLYSINALSLQADDNDAYSVFSRRSEDEAWQFVWRSDILADFADGLQTRPDPYNPGDRFFLDTPLLASSFRIRGSTVRTDGLHGLSEFQAYGVVAVPEPGSVALLVGMASISGMMLRRRRNRK